MSLLDQFEMSEMRLKKPVVRNHPKRYLGDSEMCSRKGRCLNTGSCYRCEVYISLKEIDEYKLRFSGDI